MDIAVSHGSWTSYTTLTLSFLSQSTACWMKVHNMPLYNMYAPKECPKTKKSSIRGINKLVLIATAHGLTEADGLCMHRQIYHGHKFSIRGTSSRCQYVIQALGWHACMYLCSPGASLGSALPYLKFRDSPRPAARPA